MGRGFAVGEKNRVYPVAYHNLRLLGDPEAAPAFMKALQSICAKNQLSALKNTTELIRISQLFENLSIRTISIKGPMLGLSLYGDVSLRVSKDLDILVDPLELDKAEAALKAAGYVLLEGIDALTTRQRAVILKTSQHFTFVNNEGVSVELHWRLNAAPLQFGFEELWRNSVKMAAFGGAVHVLNDEYNFLYLILHGSKHGWYRLRWLCDINEIVRGGKLDWADTRTLGQQYGMTCLIGQTMLLVQRLFGTELPFQLGREQRASRMLAEEALLFLLNPQEKMEPTQRMLVRHYRRYLWAWNQGLMSKLRYFLSRFRPSVDIFKTLHLSDSFFWLYYLVRPLAKIKQILHGTTRGLPHEDDD
ncbi:MAG: nucleotidyltransferase family protein [Eubacteriales bacterium]|nr:nucleotidyltransferase family protein [Eubacteriales bacterium]